MVTSFHRLPIDQLKLQECYDSELPQAAGACDGELLLDRCKSDPCGGAAVWALTPTARVSESRASNRHCRSE
jgi:hypothetical protein